MLRNGVARLSIVIGGRAATPAAEAVIAAASSAGPDCSLNRRGPTRRCASSSSGALATRFGNGDAAWRRHHHPEHSGLSSSPFPPPSRFPTTPTFTTTNIAKRTNFSYAGARKLSDVLKIELLENKSSEDISDMWTTYHEERDDAHGLTLDAEDSKTVVSRAAQCPFFVHPVFRDDGHFMVVSQFQPPNLFFLALLEDYSTDPSRAQPLLNVAVFDDFIETKDLALVRCDVINRGIHDDEAHKIFRGLVTSYLNDDDFRNVHVFNKTPDAFDVDDYVSVRSKRWKDDDIMEGEVVLERADVDIERAEAGSGTTAAKKDTDALNN